ncbi:MAG: hypothetical protein COB79_05015, partial [Zetaproteobacteria bacterium]
MNVKITITAAVLICLGIIMGALGAHLIKDQISPNLLLVFEKAIRYQLYGAFGMLILGLNAAKFNFKLNAFYWLTLSGIIIFSGGLYLYSCHEIEPWMKSLAKIVPVGGFAFIGAWIV